LNEVLSNPKWTDWDGNGKVSNSKDEWIELYNGGEAAVDLSGWSVTVDVVAIDSSRARPELRRPSLEKARGVLRLSGWLLGSLAKDGDRTYVFPEDTLLEPGAYLVLYQAKSGLDLPDKGFRLLLHDDTDALVDRVLVVALEEDTSYGRTADGTWAVLPLPSPGRANVAPAG
jgi:hypothetical protein